MSSFVCSDYTVLAIAEGMQRHGFIGEDPTEVLDAAEVLRYINEKMTAARYDEEVESHQKVEASSREFTDGEILVAINCWLYQIDTAPLLDFSFITIVSAVKMLQEQIIEEGTKAGTMRKVLKFGDFTYEEKDEAGDFIDIYDLYGWDLVA